MTIVLTKDTENRLRERVVSEGRDINAVVDALLSAYLDGRIAVLPPGIPSIADDDTEALNKAIAEGDDAFAQGRFRTLTEVRKDKRQRFGIE